MSQSVACLGATVILVCCFTIVDVDGLSIQLGAPGEPEPGAVADMLEPGEPGYQPGQPGEPGYQPGEPGAQVEGEGQPVTHLGQVEGQVEGEEGNVPGERDRPGVTQLGEPDVVQVEGEQRMRGEGSHRRGEDTYSQSYAAGPSSTHEGRMYREYAPSTYEVTETGFVQNVSNSFSGAAVGCVLFAVSCFLLFWNEGRAARRHQGLNQAKERVTEWDGSSKSAAGSLIHFIGQVLPQDPIQLPCLAKRVTDAVSVSRVVKVLQWREVKSSRTEKNVGGSSRTITKYDYQKEWSSQPQSSTSFRHPPHPANRTSLPVKNETFVASRVLLGEAQLSESQKRCIDASEPLPVDDASMNTLASRVGDVHRLGADSFYAGSYPNAEQIGDMKISYKVVRPCVISVVCGLLRSGNGDLLLQPFSVDSGDHIDLVYVGSKSADDCIATAQSSNATLTWVLRVVGYVLMWISSQMIAQPLVAISNVWPFLGGIVSFLISSSSAIVCFGLSVLVVAVAWLFYHPKFGIGLLLLSGCVFYYLRLVQVSTT